MPYHIHNCDYPLDNRNQNMSGILYMEVFELSYFRNGCGSDVTTALPRIELIL